MVEGTGVESSDFESQSDALLSFIAERIGVSSDAVPISSEWGLSGNTISTICLRVGLLNFEQVEGIIDAQSTSGELFGETGIRLGYLKRAELEAVLRIQQIHCYLDLGALLLIRGMVDLPQFLALVADFTDKRSGTVVETTD